MPSSTAAPSISKASASLWPYLPQVSRALPTPPMDPHPRITWDTSMPVPPRGTLCIGRGYAGRQRSRPEPSQRSPPLVTKLHAMVGRGALLPAVTSVVKVSHRTGGRGWPCSVGLQSDTPPVLAPRCEELECDVVGVSK